MAKLKQIWKDNQRIWRPYKPDALGIDYTIERNGETKIYKVSFISPAGVVSHFVPSLACAKKSVLKQFRLSKEYVKSKSESA